VYVVHSYGMDNTKFYILMG